MISCRRCGARAELYLCSTCQLYLRDMLSSLPWLLYQLEITRLRQDRLTTGVVGKGANPSPINVGCMTLAREAHAALVHLVHMLDPDVVNVDATTVQCVGWLEHGLDAIARHHEAKQFFDELASLVGDPDHPSNPGRILSAINRTARIFVGPCPHIRGRDASGTPIECGVILYADEGQDTVECSRCHLEVNVIANRTKASVDRDLLPEARLLEVLETLDEKVSRSQLYLWIKAGRLHPRGWIHQGQIVERKVRHSDPRVFSLSQTRHLRWADSPAIAG